MKFKEQLIKPSDVAHKVQVTGRAIAHAVNFGFVLNDTEEGLSVSAVGPLDEELEAAGGPGGAVNFDLAYRLVIPANAVYRFTYHHHWSGHGKFYIGFYDEKRDVNFPMYLYTGGSGYGSRTFDIAAQTEDLAYIMYGQWSRRVGLASLPWSQPPARLANGSPNTVVFGPYDHINTKNIGWMSWGILTIG